MNYYEILGVKKTATKEEIKDAYKLLVKKYHPDVYVGDKHFAEKKIKEINNAYDTLSDEKLKKEYDEIITPTPQYTYNTDFGNSSTSNYDSNSYNNYKSQKNYNSTNYQEANPFYNYSYSNTRNKYENIIYNKIDNLETKTKITFFFIIIFLFLLFFLSSTLKWYYLLTEKNNANDDSNPPTTIERPVENNIKNKSNNNYKIYDYFSESELQELYDNYFYSYYDSYEDFEKSVSNYLEKNGY